MKYSQIPNSRKRERFLQDLWVKTKKRQAKACRFKLQSSCRFTEFFGSKPEFAFKN